MKDFGRIVTNAMATAKAESTIETVKNYGGFYVVGDAELPLSEKLKNAEEKLCEGLSITKRRKAAKNALVIIGTLIAAILVLAIISVAIREPSRNEKAFLVCGSVVMLLVIISSSSIKTEVEEVVFWAAYISKLLENDQIGSVEAVTISESKKRLGETIKFLSGQALG